MKRPATVTVFGILNILYGGLSIVGTLFSLMVIYLGSGDVTLGMVESNAVYAAWTKLAVVLGAIAAVVVIAAGIGLLKMMPWARIASVGYGVYSVVIFIVGVVLGWIFVYSPLLEEMGAFEDSTQKGAMLGGLIGGVLGGFLGLIYPAALLYFMTRPGIVRAFEGATPKSTTSTPQPSRSVAAVPPPALDDSNPYAPPASPLQTDAGALDTGDEVLATVIPFRNKPALISYYLGLFSLASLIPVLGVVGIGMAVAAFVLGVKGRRLAKEHAEAKGTAHAWVGILGGAFWGVLGVLVQVLFIVAMAGSTT